MRAIRTMFESFFTLCFSLAIANAQCGTTSCANCCAGCCGSVCMDNVTCWCGLAPSCAPNSGGCVPVCPCDSPIILDPFDQGFHLTSVADGVKFRVRPNGPPQQMSWTDARWRNGWLALDRNENGKIDDFSELFGNKTQQPPSDEPNGYRALAVFDDSAKGGNGNGFIDPRDTIYEFLKVWIDENQNGISEPNELNTLQELRIIRIGLRYRATLLTDENGNWFRYKAPVWDNRDDRREICYDVFLAVEAQKVKEK